MTAKRPRLFNLPNLLTLGRIGAVPVLVILMAVGEGGRLVSWLSALVFLLASLTDLLDGYLARRYKQVTNVGRFLDPLADKLLVSAALIMLIPLGRAPAWLVFLIIGREITITALRSIAAGEGVIIEASSLGKQKTATQSVAIFGLLWHYSFLWADAHAVGLVLLWLALIMTYWSGIAYFAAFYRVFSGRPE